MVVLDGCDEMNGNLLRIGEHPIFFFFFSVCYLLSVWIKNLRATGIDLKIRQTEHKPLQIVKFIFRNKVLNLGIYIFCFILILHLQNCLYLQSNYKLHI